MKIIELQQGSADWLAIRANYFTASEAPAMLGLSRYKTRAALLREKATGATEEVDSFKQAAFDRGHEAEAAARPLVEAFLQEDLYPCTGTLEVEGLPLLASFDGLTMGEDVDWENKLHSDSLAAMVASGDLDGTYWPQLEHQLLVSGAKRALFTLCDGEKLTAQLWYESKPDRRAQLIAGWKQFHEDLKTYTPPEVIPAAVAEPIKDLPTLFIQARGEVTKTNMPEFKAQITEFLGSINMKPATDQEFADGKEVAKKLRELAVKIKERKADMLAQTATIGEVAVEIDHLAEVINANALELEKAVKREEDARKLAIVSDGRAAFADHVAALNTRLGKPYMPAIPADFAEAIKGKRLITAMQDAVATLLANKKIEASAIADRIEINLNFLRENAKDYAFLFADTATIVLKQKEDFEALAKLRIAEHKEAEAKRLEAETMRIRAEEEAKAAAKVKAEQEAADRATMQRDFERNLLSQPTSMPVTVVVEPTKATAEQAYDVDPMHMPDTGRMLKLGEISTALGVGVTAEFLALLGFQAKQEKNARLYREADFQRICGAVARHIINVGETYGRKAA